MIESRLRKKINPAPQLYIKKKRQARIEKVVDVAVDDGGCSKMASVTSCATRLLAHHALWTSLLARE
jgi:hypothetical protein